MDYETLYDKIMKFVMPQSFPVGVKMICAEEPFPESAVRPAKFGIQVALCQWINMSRRWGWVTGAMAEDINCVPCLAGFGFKRLRRKDDLTAFLIDMGYGDSDEIARSLTEEFEFLTPGQFRGIVISPLNKATMDPDLVLIYGTPAQMIRLTLAYAHSYGKLIKSVTGFGFSCLSNIMPLLSSEPTLVHPGRGERMLAGVDDSEMCFSMPRNYLEKIVEGLEITHKKGMRYPVQGYLLYNAPVLPPMKAFEEKLLEP